MITRIDSRESKKTTNTCIDRVTKIENDVEDLEIRFEKVKIRSRIWAARLRSEFCQELKDKCEEFSYLQKRAINWENLWLIHHRNL